MKLRDLHPTTKRLVLSRAFRSIGQGVLVVDRIRPSKPIFNSMILAAIFTGKKDHGTQKSSIPGNV